METNQYRFLEAKLFRPPLSLFLSAAGEEMQAVSIHNAVIHDEQQAGCEKYRQQVLQFVLASRTKMAQAIIDVED